MSPFARLRALSPRRRALAVVLAVLLLVGVVAVAVPLLRASRATPVPDPSAPGTVLLVPGYGGSRDSLSVLAGRIRATGRDTEVLTLPGDGTGDLLAQTDVLAAAVDRALTGGSGPVDLIGYSAGGVVARLWAEGDGAAAQARRVITLGAPLHGTTLAGVGGALVPGACPQACQQLAPGSALLRRIDAEALPAGLSWTSVWTTEDQTVTPPDSARLTGAVNIPVQQVCADAHVQHGQLPSDPLVTGIVLRELSALAPSVPAAADCTALRAAGGGR